MTTHVYATTTLFSNRNKPYPYAIHFTVDSDGRIKFEKGIGELPVRPYMLLHLVRDVYNIMGIIPRTNSTVEFVKNPLRHSGPGYSGHPALEIMPKDKRYRLDYEVSGRWIANPDVPSMVKYIEDLPKDKKNPTYLLTYFFSEPGYNLLNPANCTPWRIFFQEA